MPENASKHRGKSFPCQGFLIGVCASCWRTCGPLPEIPSRLCPGKVNLSWDQARLPGTPRPLPGQYIVFTSRIRPVSSFTNIDAAERGNDIAAYWAAKDVWFNAWIMSRPGRASPARTEGSPDFGPGLREKVRTAFVRSLGEPTSLSFTTEERHKKRPDSARFMTQGQAMLPALLFGDRYALDSVTLDLFTRAGLVHSLALSGQHLALALLLACGCAALTGRLYPAFSAYAAPQTDLCRRSAPCPALSLAGRRSAFPDPGRDHALCRSGALAERQSIHFAGRAVSCRIMLSACPSCQRL